ncbi:glucans biosynthesis glucosyltransferase MdoH [Roseomonas sp. BN140053]|uniref:glucans biosynthesis glucosyltransferase MdoH n=1 Tax=Roseomonas sp. BN140053 TaxID=3391898 RepID=UPI0039EA6AC9
MSNAPLRPATAGEAPDPDAPAAGFATRRPAGHPAAGASAVPPRGVPFRAAAEPIRARRRLFTAAVTLLTLLLLAAAWPVLAPGGWTVWEVLIALCLLFNAPWLALSAATGLVGFALRLGSRDPVAAVLPQLHHAPRDAPITLHTAVAACIRSEKMDAVVAPLDRLLRGLDAAGAGDRFTVWLLSDTSDPAHAAVEEAAVAAFAAAHPPGRVRYRRRAQNTGFKAGNVMEFLDHHAGEAALMLSWDADSTMNAPAVLQLVRVMQADPGLAIVQPTIAARAPASRFAALFGLGHRAGSRIWATGQAWWQGDEGPFWGHNALLRIAPFREHARLDLLPDGAHILSHDHVEAARLHGAGWKVRVLPDDHGSRDTQPPNLPEFLGRDARWLAGNLQYRFLLRRQDLGPLGRFQMLQAILHYALTPFWFAILPLAALNAATGGGATTPRGALLFLLALWFVALHLPKLLGYVEDLIQSRHTRLYGGRLAYAGAALGEMVFTQLFDPLIALQKTTNIARAVAASLMPHRRTAWATQHRQARRIGWAEAARLYWPHTLLGLALAATFAAASPVVALLALPAYAGLLVAIPFCVLTAVPLPPRP